MRKVQKYCFGVLFALFGSFTALGQGFFNTGVWLKFGVTEPGIHSISLSTLEAEGLDVSDPDKLAVYGGKTEMYPQKNIDNLNFSPEEVSSWISSNDVQGDAIYFHSSGVVHTSYSSALGLQSTINLYSDTIFYYVTLSSTPKRVADMVTDGATSGSDSLVGYKYLESETENILGSGRNWYSNKISPDDPKSTFNIPLTDFARNLEVNYQIVGSSPDGLFYSEMGTPDSVYSKKIIFKTSAGYGTKARSQKDLFSIPNSEVKDEITLVHGFDEDAGERALLYMDYLALSYTANHEKLEGNVSYYSLESIHNSFSASVSSAGNIVLLKDLETKEQALVSPFVADGLQHFTNNYLNAEAVFLKKNEFYAAPIFQKRIENFNLTVNESPELLILYHPSLKEEVERLKEHKTALGLKTIIVDVDQVKDHYSSGGSDVSGIRNYIKYVYETSSKLRYLLIVGDCSFDYKDRLAGNTNMIPVYQSRESFHDVQTFSSDDFYGFLEDDEGEWSENSSGNHTLDISVGRIPAQTKEETKKAVDKIIFYETDESSSTWKNNIIFVADDKDNALHVKQVNELVDRVQSMAPFIRDKKIYVDAYDRPGDDVSDIREDLFSSIEEGAMVVNFTGHGTEFTWTEEEILTLQTVKDLDNKTKLPLFVTATCEFGRYDDPRLSSGAEALLLNEAGAIGLVTTTRPVYASSNFTINKAFYDELFKKENGFFRSLGDVFRTTKNTSLNSVFNRNFSLLADPSLHLKLPENEVYFDKINNDSVSTFRDTIGLGEKFYLDLLVTSPDGLTDSSFNGIATLSFYDQPQTSTTKGKGGQPTINFTKTSDLIYEVNVGVVNGVINTELVLPKGINPAYRKISMIVFASNEQGKFAYGTLNNLVLGGVEPDTNSNEQQMTVTLTSQNQDASGKYGEDAELVFRIEDTDGILFSPILIGKEAYYTLDEDTLTKNFINPDKFSLINGVNTIAELDVPLEGLSLGEHVIKLRLYDANGTPSNSEFEFSVSSLVEVSLYPNPVKTELFLGGKRSIDRRSLSYTVVLYSTYGQEILAETGDMNEGQSFEKKVFSENIQNLAPGIYNYSISMRYRDGRFYQKTGQITKF